jgi:hypothetical protein
MSTLQNSCRLFLQSPSPPFAPPTGGAMVKQGSIAITQRHLTDPLVQAGSTTRRRSTEQCSVSSSGPAANRNSPSKHVKQLLWLTNPSNSSQVSMQGGLFQHEQDKRLCATYCTRYLASAMMIWPAPTHPAWSSSQSTLPPAPFQKAARPMMMMHQSDKNLQDQSKAFAT